MEDYKEKYEQALQRAKQFSEKPFLEDSKGIVEYIFPELAESEDERIRKELLNYLYDVHDDDEERARWIAWLEKQGEQKFAWKPSDEQIKVCKEVYADILSAKGFDLGTVLSEMNRLEEELKKLKG